MEIQLNIVGIVLIVLASIHILFPRYFNWKSDLKEVMLINRQLMYVHTFFIALTVFLMGYLCLTASTELLSTYLGKKILLGLTVFWLLRLVIQLIGYSKQLWKGKTFETIIHLIFVVLWAYISTVFFLCYMYK